jgi:hypothetical protein
MRISPGNRLSIMLGRSIMSIPLSSGAPLTVSIFNLRGGLVSSAPVSIGTDGACVARPDFAGTMLAKGQYVVQVKAGKTLTTQTFGVAR